MGMLQARVSHERAQTGSAWVCMAGLWQGHTHQRLHAGQHAAGCNRASRQGRHAFRTALTTRRSLQGQPGLWCLWRQEQAGLDRTRGAHVSRSSASTSGVSGSTTTKNLVPVSVWKQCRSNVSARSSSMPVQPGAGASCTAIAWSECLPGHRYQTRRRSTGGRTAPESCAAKKGRTRCSPGAVCRSGCCSRLSQTPAAIEARVLSTRIYCSRI